jgi:hypothetical protein
MGRPRKIKKSNAGRPTVMTPDVIVKLEQAFAIDSTVQEACSYAEISHDAFYDYLKKNPQFSDRIADLRNRPILAARERVVKGIRENYSNAMDYLRRKKRAEFGDSVDHTTGGKPLQIVFDNAFTSTSTKDSAG